MSQADISKARDMLGYEPGGAPRRRPQDLFRALPQRRVHAAVDPRAAASDLARSLAGEQSSAAASEFYGVSSRLWCEEGDTPPCSAASVRALYSLVAIARRTQVTAVRRTTSSHVPKMAICRSTKKPTVVAGGTPGRTSLFESCAHGRDRHAQRANQREDVQPANREEAEEACLDEQGEVARVG